MSSLSQPCALPERLHLPVSQFCRVCGEPFVYRAQVIVLLDNEDRTGFSGKIVPAFPYSRTGVSVASADFLRICSARSFANCSVCVQKPPIYGVSMHQLCVDSFMAEPQWSAINVAGHDVHVPADAPTLGKKRRASLLDDLWTAASFRTPWADVLDLNLKRSHVLQHGSAVPNRVVSLLGLPDMTRLPTELLLIIWKMSEASPLSQAIKAHLLRLDVEETRGKANYNYSGDASLADVVLWQRGLGPLHLADMAQRDSLPPVVKVTIDSMGILAIERLAERPPAVSRVVKAMPTRAYVIEDVREKRDKHTPQQPEADTTAAASAVESTTLELRFGRLRLRVPERGAIPIWNCSSPPELRAFRFLALRYAAAPLALLEHDAQLTACDLNKCAGVTFVFYRSAIVDVKFHGSIDDGSGTPNDPGKPHTSRSSAYWAFVPIGPGDCVTGIWLHPNKPNCLVFRLKLAGDVPVGTMVSPSLNMALLAHGTSITLACKVPQHGATLQTIGASGSEDIPQPNPPSELLPIARDEVLGELFPRHRISFIRDKFWSTAPLADVVRIRVLTARRYSICVGLLCFYSNGAVRALGECHPDRSIAEDFESPTSICFRIERFGERRPRALDMRDEGVFFKVVGKDTVHTSHEEDDWICKPLGSGTLDFYVSPNVSYAMRIK